MQDSTQSHLGLIKEILSLDRKQRTVSQSNILITYLQKLKVFQDLLADDMDAYLYLSKAVELMTFEEGEDIITEGDDGDTFYFILEGQVNVLKVQMIPISTDQFEKETVTQLMKEALILAYYRAFKENYTMMFWKDMDISRQKVAWLLGLDDDLDLDPRFFAKPLDEKKQHFLWEYI